VLTIAMLLMSIALIFIGIGQRRYRRWAQLASVTWGWLGLIILAFQFAFWLNVVSPALDTFMESLSLFHGKGSLLSGFSNSFGFISLFLYAPYPILLIILMGRPSIVRSMSQ
jgi:hypothetical protein